MLNHGIAKNPEKDIDDSLNATCVGVDLVDGREWRPPAGRLWMLLDGVLDLCNLRVGSPGGIAAYIGVAQWYNLLRRLHLSIYDALYDFSSGEKAKDWTSDTLSDAIIGELLIDLILVFCVVDMALPFLPVVAATDASTVFGHGGVVSNATVSEVMEIARLACKSGGHVRLDDGPELSEELAARLGPRHIVPLKRLKSKAPDTFGDTGCCGPCCCPK